MVTSRTGAYRAFGFSTIPPVENNDEPLEFGKDADANRRFRGYVVDRIQFLRVRTEES